MDFPKYTEIDGKLHLIVEGERTECGLPIPYPSTWVKDTEGAKVHCGKDPEPTVLDTREGEDPPMPFAAPVEEEPEPKPAKASKK